MRRPCSSAIGDVLVDVALRIDDGGGVRRFVADEIRRVREAIQVELFQDHVLDPKRSRASDKWIERVGLATPSVAAIS